MIAILRGHLLTCASVGVEHQSCDYFFRCAPVCDRDEGCGNTSWKCGEDETLAVWGHVIRVPKRYSPSEKRADLAQFKLSARRVHAGNVDMRHAARDLSDDQWSVLDPGLSFPGSTQVHGVPDQPEQKGEDCSSPAQIRRHWILPLGVLVHSASTYWQII